MGKSRGRSPQPPAQQTASNSSNEVKGVSYKSDGVQDHDVFLLPGSDYVAGLVVLSVATAVRIFRIYQPSSVVFDEVQ